MPSLFTENGPNAGQNYPVEGTRLVLGRHPDCDVVVDVGAVSRHHAHLVKVEGRYYLEDLKSRNGTLVNGQPVLGRQLLKDGDRIQICDISFLFGNQPRHLLSGTDEPSSVLLEDNPDDPSIVMSSLNVFSGSGSVAVTSTSDVKLRALVQITTSLSRTLALDEVLPQLLDSLFKLFVQADRGFIVLRNEVGELIPRWTKLRRGDDDRMIRLSRTILNQVVESKQAILSTDTGGDQRFQMSESIAGFRIRSFICAPLVNVEGEVLGVIQLDSLDYRNRFRAEDLEILASVAGQAAIAVDNADLHDQVVRQRILEKDLELAQQVQQGFLPQKSPQMVHYEHKSFYRPANLVGGDYFDYITLPDGRVAVVLADVVGHGMAAALQTAQLSAALRFSLATRSDPADAICELNRTLCEGSLDDRFITLVMVVLHPESQRITIVNAGHMPPLLWHGDHEPIEIGAHVKGLPLLIFDSYKYRSVDVTLNHDDHVLLYTDGVNEYMLESGEQYGIERLRQRVRGCYGADEATQRIVQGVEEFAQGAPQLDDMCMVCFRRS